MSACLHVVAAFTPYGDLVCSDCQTPLTEEQAYKGPWVEPFTGATVRREYVVRWDAAMGCRRSRWFSDFADAKLHAETLGLCSFSEFELDDGAVRFLRIWTRGDEWVAGEWKRPAIKGARIPA